MRLYDHEKVRERRLTTDTLWHPNMQVHINVKAPSQGQQADTNAIAEIRQLAHSYEQDDINRINPDAFVNLVQDYLLYSCVDYNEKRKEYFEGNHVARVALDAIKSFRVPIERRRLEMFCRSLKDNEEYLVSVSCNDGTNIFLKGIYHNILKKTGRACARCINEYKRTATPEELAEINSMDKTVCARIAYFSRAAHRARRNKVIAYVLAAAATALLLLFIAL